MCSTAGGGTHGCLPTKSVVNFEFASSYPKILCNCVSTIMGYYDDQKNVEQYIQMADGYDGKLLIDALRKHLPDGKSVLELGMGPGKDLLLLNEHYQVTGSDASAIFVNRFKQLHPKIDVLHLDAVTLETSTTYDALYSNKVLYHLSRDDLKQSFLKQADILQTGGIALHSFWYGDEESEHEGLRFVYYTEATLKAQINNAFDVVEINRYTEMETDDSLYIILRKRP